MTSPLMHATSTNRLQNHRDDLEDLKAKCDAREIADRLLGPGVTHRDHNKYYAPNRSERTPSFAVYSDHWYDYGASDRYGDVISLVMLVQNCDFKSALRYVKDHVGDYVRDPDVPRIARKNASASNEPPSAEWQQAASKLVREAQDYLWSDAPDARKVLKYLRHNRGLHDETIRAFQLGYLPDWTPLEWQSEADGSKRKVAPGIVIPWYCDDVLRAVRVRTRTSTFSRALGRKPDKAKGKELDKYLCAPGSKLTGALFNSDAIARAYDVYSVEGEFDCMLATQQSEGRVAFVTLGSATNKLSNRWAKELAKKRTVGAFPDNDAAGQGAVERLREPLGDKLQIIQLPLGKDVTEYIVDHGGDIMKLIYASRSLWPNGVPDTWRSALLIYFRPSTAAVMELIDRAIRAGRIHPEGFTISDIVDAGNLFGMPLAKSTTSSAVEELLGLFFQKLPPNSGVPTGGNFCENEILSRGRRPAAYKLRAQVDCQASIVACAKPRLIETHHPISGDNPVSSNCTVEMMKVSGVDLAIAEELAEEIGGTLAAAGHTKEMRRADWTVEQELKKLVAALADMSSVDLPSDWIIGSAADYRAAYLHAKVRAVEPKRWSRSEQLHLLGLSSKTSLRRTRFRAGVRSVQQLDDIPLGKQVISPDSLERLARKAGGYPRALVAQTATGQEVLCSPSPEISAQFVAVRRSYGDKLFLRCQMPSLLEIFRDGPLPMDEEKEEEPDDGPTGGDAESLDGNESESSDQTIAQKDKSQAKRCKAKNKSIQSSDHDRWFGPAHDPDWVRGQLMLALCRCKSEQYIGDGLRAIDTQTGEVLRNCGFEDLLERLLGRKPRAGARGSETASAVKSPLSTTSPAGDCDTRFS